MRIIAGELRGRKLKSPIGKDVRPTSDKVKEAVFSMLIPYMEPGFCAVDLFAGSGNLGLEAISRGACTVFFSDQSPESLALVRENVKTCNVSDKAIYLRGDFKSNIRRVSRKADIFFLDPPYADGMILPALQAIDEKDNIKEGGVVVCEHSFREQLPEKYCGFVTVKSRRYGSVAVTIYERRTQEQ